MMHISVFLRQFAFIDFLWFSPYAHTHTHTRQCLRSSSSLRAALHVFWMTLSAAMQTFSNEHLVQIDWTQAQVTGPVCVCASGCASVPACVCGVCAGAFLHTAEASFLAFYCMPITCYFLQLSFCYSCAACCALNFIRIPVVKSKLTLCTTLDPIAWQVWVTGFSQWLLPELANIAEYQLAWKQTSWECWAKAFEQILKLKQLLTLLGRQSLMHSVKLLLSSWICIFP